MRKCKSSVDSIDAKWARKRYHCEEKFQYPATLSVKQGIQWHIWQYFAKVQLLGNWSSFIIYQLVDRNIGFKSDQPLCLCNLNFYRLKKSLAQKLHNSLKKPWGVHCGWVHTSRVSIESWTSKESKLTLVCSNRLRGIKTFDWFDQIELFLQLLQIEMVVDPVPRCASVLAVFKIVKLFSHIRLCKA